MQKAINRQINAELWSAYLYLSMAMDAEAKALKGIARWFHIQSREEQDHAMILQNHLNDRGARVQLLPIEGVPTEWQSPLEMFQNTLEHEKTVTSMIDKLMREAMGENDYPTMCALHWFVEEQVEEESQAAQLVSDFERAGNDPGAVHALDRELAEREYEKASPLK